MVLTIQINLFKIKLFECFLFLTTNPRRCCRIQWSVGNLYDLLDCSTIVCSTIWTILNNFGFQSTRCLVLLIPRMYQTLIAHFNEYAEQVHCDFKRARANQTHRFYVFLNISKQYVEHTTILCTIAHPVSADLSSTMIFSWFQQIELLRSMLSKFYWITIPHSVSVFPNPWPISVEQWPYKV